MALRPQLMASPATSTSPSPDRAHAENRPARCQSTVGGPPDPGTKATKANHACLTTAEKLSSATTA